MLFKNKALSIKIIVRNGPNENRIVISIATREDGIICRRDLCIIIESLSRFKGKTIKIITIQNNLGALKIWLKFEEGLQLWLGLPEYSI